MLYHLALPHSSTFYLNILNLATRRFSLYIFLIVTQHKKIVLKEGNQHFSSEILQIKRELMGQLS